MKFIIGLGNYPEKYKYTRHNFGFLALDYLAKALEFSDFKKEKIFYGLISEGEIMGEKILLCKPETYMNLSGKSVSALTQFYKGSPQDVLIFQDDLDMVFGTTKFRKKGRSGGHNGLSSIIGALGTDEFSRIKFGIANSQKEKIPGDRFVLMEFTDEEKEKLSDVFQEGLAKLLEYLKSLKKR